MLPLVLSLLTSVLKQREVPATVSSFYVSVLYTTMLRRSIAAVVLGCFYFCPLDCDDSVMVDCVAVETGCMLEKFMKYFFSVSATTTFLCVYSIAVAVVEKGYALLFSVEVLLLLFIFLVGCAAADAGACAAYNISTEAERDAWDVYCCCCSCLLLFLSFRLRRFGYGC